MIPHQPVPPLDELLLAWLHRLAALAQAHVVLLVLVAIVAAAGWGVRLVVRRRARRRWHADARVITVLPPATLDPAGAIAGARRLWRDLMGIAPPLRRRLLTGVPHLVVEFWLVGGEELAVRIWIPGPVAHGRVENAVHTAWPGAVILRDHTNPPTLPADGAVTGGRVRPERSDEYPLHVPEVKDDADPLRTLEALASSLAAGESVVVQVLARPAVGRRLRRYRSRVHRLHTQGRPMSTSWVTTVVTAVVRAVLDLFTPGRGTASTSTGNRTRFVDPLWSEDLRAMRGKADQPQWEVALRYAVATTATGDEAIERVRGVADAVFAVFAVLAGRNALARHRLRHPATVLGARRVRRGALLSVPELAAVAHLPARTLALASGAARAVPAPRQVTGAPVTPPRNPQP
jgi:hypothetical protein